MLKIIKAVNNHYFVAIELLLLPLKALLANSFKLTCFLDYLTAENSSSYCKARGDPSID
jgi:hypothetical protein